MYGWGRGERAWLRFFTPPREPSTVSITFTIGGKAGVSEAEQQRPDCKQTETVSVYLAIYLLRGF